jgi:hypothetical protein
MSLAVARPGHILDYTLELAKGTACGGIKNRKKKKKKKEKRMKIPTSLLVDNE